MRVKPDPRYIAEVGEKDGKINSRTVESLNYRGIKGYLYLSFKETIMMMSKVPKWQKKE
ncbi:MAG: hypothetical protein ACTSUN_02385 [Promethearchaeota archaeon]